ncbi:MAG: oligopeptide transporter, OPT family [Alphaproteobacteria bacterium 16-39-46]|nr:MAG: oligopeptide transporter, OPT family [Alphaproteobacteria bacterium 16-39-46]OZA43295.1 MAG: oligopeptide transporter, OPT family [Alphaproteobacteria bacterium 17-39-52]HQS84073.1 oligopeptide transporter, OPT family [Alphaproteobacteria bacterium]HQS93935.1 oligopeptide transporter, OPT family [Alphaproteobacteria bacterium]
MKDQKKTEYRNKQKQTVVPYIPASKNLPEVTVKAVILGIILAVILAGSNAYLGLKIGLTVSACIPAAVISMAVLRFFKTSNILENNMVQTIASAGEVLAAAIIYTLPALILLNFWTYFPFLETVSIACIGGIMGVLMSVPLRRAMIIDNPLPFPEGVATAEVLKAGDGNTTGASDMLVSGILAALIKLFQSGFQMIGETASVFTSVGPTLFGCGTGLSTALIGAGYIVGIRIGICFLIGTVIVWIFGIPIYGAIYGLPEADSLAATAQMIWAQKLRYIGVGAMIVGGVWTLITLVKPIVAAVKSSYAALKHTHLTEATAIPRTEKDIPMTYVLAGSLFLIIPVAVIFFYILNKSHMPITTGLFGATIVFATVFSFFIGFLCSAIGGYMAGIVGSSSNPLSGVTIGGVLSVSFLLLLLLGTQIDFSIDPNAAGTAAAFAIIIGAVIACAANLSCDNLQDLKAGQLVGSTPWKQQALLIVGVVVGAIVITPILQLLYEAYGIGTSLPRPGMDPTQALAAPQATVMASVAKGIFTHNLEWTYVVLGGLIAIANIILNKILKSIGSDWTFPALAVASGLYLPYTVSVTIFLGSLLSLLALRVIKAKKRSKKFTDDDVATCERRGLLFASGTIAGESLVGILLAIPFALYQSTDIFKVNLGFGSDITMLLGALVTGFFCFYFFRTGSTPFSKK